jgi:hypothetical protein
MIEIMQKLGRTRSKLGLTRALVLGLGWVRVRFWVETLDPS